MTTHFSDSQLAIFSSLFTSTTTTASVELQKAWHLLSLLLSTGFPTPPTDLASRCVLFNATSDLVLYLCSLPFTPISLTPDDCGNALVTVSPVAFCIFERLVSNFNYRMETKSFQSRRPLEDIARIYFRKRKRVQFDSEHEVINLEAPSRTRIRKSFYKVELNVGEGMNRCIHINSSFTPVKLSSIIWKSDLFPETANGNFGSKLKNIKQIEGEMCPGVPLEVKDQKRIMLCELDVGSTRPCQIMADEALSQEAKVYEIDLNNTPNFAVHQEDANQSSMLPLDSLNANDACNEANGCYIESVEAMQENEETFNCSEREKEAEEISQENTLLNKRSEVEDRRVNEMTSCDTRPSLAQKQLLKPDSKKIQSENGMNSRLQVLCQSPNNSNAMQFPQDGQRDQKTISKERNPKLKYDDPHGKETRRNAASSPHTDHLGSKERPCFESYVVEEEEGSGGYGIVYRARRKIDGTTVAIKCPHANAHRHHVSNEMRMLERFGGRNFIIKYEGCFKSGNSECFVLQHVEHDRPEVLKKEIDVYQLRWYGYCLFRALASLHKQGIVHRDVKPGNFLFSCKSNKGYLIDFNLAMDLHHKYSTTSKPKMENATSFDHVKPVNAKALPPAKSRRFTTAKSMVAINQKEKGFKSGLESKNLKRKPVDQTKASNELGGCNILRSQGEGSGITSIKDVTGTKTLSAERLREPLPCHGRKELINLLQGSIQTTNHEASSVSSSMRKRIAASPAKFDSSFYPTPMPQHFIGIVPNGTRDKGDGRHKKEGPCVGTKGFRAPEVLFRSLHQGPKVDIWSAGVTLLYLVTGRTPFFGDPEQNIKDIAKFRGNEDLWEVAKLHDRESSFPVDLYNMRFSPSITPIKWCKMNTRRRDFLDSVPTSLIDLIDKCLTVNPRLRISAENALKHEFFAPCHEELRNHRLLRQETKLDC
ncbi:hypothetical protein K2173_002836 [Erythroxylum novogranatense]|uniref:non-specific serine/threonine protein kinase n=1 Tax=Erythroxylum novogranatense TaxID=1862640 RepID=A0AAV8SQT2_9ROSI|nr:hypothetical protein K2173_002836 [Erythroxylum novogranatense]